jgi:hypothetical protein
VGQEPAGPIGSAIELDIALPRGGDGHLTLDPAGVQTLINHLDQAIVKLEDIFKHGRELMRLEPPGDDPFSPIAVADILHTAGDDEGGHLWANARAQHVFQATIDNLRASLAAYRESESGNADKFRGGT